MEPHSLLVETCAPVPAWTGIIAKEFRYPRVHERSYNREGFHVAIRLGFCADILVLGGDACMKDKELVPNSNSVEMRPLRIKTCGLKTV